MSSTQSQAPCKNPLHCAASLRDLSRRVWGEGQVPLPRVGLWPDLQSWRGRGGALPCSTPALCPAFVLPKAEVCVRNHVQPYISSILEALMTPTSQGFAEVREVFFKEVTDMNLNIINEGGMDKLAEVRPGDAPCWLVGLGVVGPGQSCCHPWCRWHWRTLG